MSRAVERAPLRRQGPLGKFHRHVDNCPESTEMPNSSFAATGVESSQCNTGVLTSALPSPSPCSPPPSASLRRSNGTFEAEPSPRLISGTPTRASAPRTPCTSHLRPKRALGRSRHWNAVFSLLSVVGCCQRHRQGYSETRGARHASTAVTVNETARREAPVTPPWR